MLIIGGLIALAILALLAAILLVREEGNSQKSSTAVAHNVQEVADHKSIEAPKQATSLQQLIEGEEPENGQLYELFHMVQSLQEKQKETDLAMEQVNALVKRLEISKETVRLPVVP